MQNTFLVNLVTNFNLIFLLIVTIKKMFSVIHDSRGSNIKTKLKNEEKFKKEKWLDEDRFKCSSTVEANIFEKNLMKINKQGKKFIVSSRKMVISIPTLQNEKKHFLASNKHKSFGCNETCKTIYKINPIICN